MGKNYRSLNLLAGFLNHQQYPLHIDCIYIGYTFFAWGITPHTESVGDYHVILPGPEMATSAHGLEVNFVLLFNKRPGWDVKGEKMLL